MTCVSLLNRRRAEEFSSSMPSLDVMLFHHSVAKGRSLHGKPGMCVTRLLMSSANSANTPPAVDDEDLETLENFVVMMYDRSSTAEGVDDARLDMFARKQRPYEAIPPTRDALLQHVKRAAYQAGCIWSQSTVCQPETQSPADWGWTKKGDLWQIFWTELLPIAESCEQLTKCGCKSECHGRCKCYRFGLTCTILCCCRCQD